MPKVQTYGASKVTSQVASQQRLNSFQVADTTTPILRGAQNGINAFMTEKKRIDDTAAEDSLVKFEREKNKMFFDPESGYFNSQGRDAYDGAKDVSKSLTELQAKYADQLSSEDARAAFKKASDVHVTRGMNDISRHSAAGLDAYETATMQSRVENSVESIGLYWNSDEDVNIQRAVGRNSIIDMAERKGLGSEATNELLQNFESQSTKARIVAAMTNDVTAGKEMFDKYADRMEPQDRAGVEANIKKAVFDMDSANLTSKIVSPGRSLGSMVDEVNNLPTNTPEEVAMKTEVMRQVKNQYSLNKQLDDERKNDIYQDYGKQVQDGQITSRDIPAEAWNIMTVGQRTNIHKIEALNAKGVPVVTDMRTYTELMTLPDKDKAKLDPMNYIDKLDEGDYKKLVTQVDQAKNGKTSDPSYTHVVTDAARLSNLTKQVFGKTPAKLTSSQSESYNAMARSLQQRLTADEVDKGRKLLPEEKDKIYQEFARTQVIEKNWWPDSETNIGDIDPLVIDHVTTILRENNIPINPINIINFVRVPANADTIKQDLGIDIDL